MRTATSEAIKLLPYDPCVCLCFLLVALFVPIFVEIQLALEKLDLFHRMEIFWKYCRKRLENPVSIVLSNYTVWKCFLWYGNILEIL